VIQRISSREVEVSVEGRVQAVVEDLKLRGRDTGRGIGSVV
jgi:hypothetical protein